MLLAVEDMTGGWALAALTAFSSAVALFFAWLMARDRLRHDEKIVILEHSIKCLNEAMAELKTETSRLRKLQYRDPFKEK